MKPKKALQAIKTIWIISTIRKNMGSKIEATIKVQNSERPKPSWFILKFLLQFNSLKVDL